jgi:hypothetical protein
VPTIDRLLLDIGGVGSAETLAVLRAAIGRQ